MTLKVTKTNRGTTIRASGADAARLLQLLASPKGEEHLEVVLRNSRASQVASNVGQSSLSAIENDAKGESL